MSDKKEKTNPLFGGKLGTIEGYSVYDHETGTSKPVSAEEFFKIVAPDGKVVILTEPSDRKVEFQK